MLSSILIQILVGALPQPLLLLGRQRFFGKWISDGDNPKHFGPRIFIVFLYNISIMKTQKQHTLTDETTERRQHLGSLPILAQTVREK